MVSVEGGVRGLEPLPEVEPEVCFLKLQPARSPEVTTRIARKRGFMLGFISDSLLLHDLANSLRYTLQIIPFTRQHSNPLRKALDSLIPGLRAELLGEKRFHQVLVPFDNSISVEAIRDIRGCAHLIIKTIRRPG
jgi:hypothetical protein